jgi:hypothetical protein
MRRENRKKMPTPFYAVKIFFCDWINIRNWNWNEFSISKQVGRLVHFKGTMSNLFSRCTRVCVYIIDKKLNFTTLMPGMWNAFAAIIAKCGATADACTQLDKLDLNAHWHWYSWNCRHFSLELQERVDPVPALLESLEEFLEMSGKFQTISQIKKCTKNGFNTFVF